MPQNGLSGPTVGSNLLGHTSRWLALPFPSPFNPIRATLDVIYLFIYLFSKDVSDSYQGRSGAFFLVKRWLTSSHRSVSSSAAADGSGDRLRVCLYVCVFVSSSWILIERVTGRTCNLFFWPIQTSTSGVAGMFMFTSFCYGHKSLKCKCTTFQCSHSKMLFMQPISFSEHYEIWPQSWLP